MARDTTTNEGRSRSPRAGGDGTVCQGGGSRVAAGPAVLSPAQVASLLSVNLNPIAQSMSYS